MKFPKVLEIRKMRKNLTVGKTKTRIYANITGNLVNAKNRQNFRENSPKLGKLRETEKTGQTLGKNKETKI